MNINENRDDKIGQIVVESKVAELNRMTVDEIRDTIAKMLKGKKKF